MYQSTSSFLRDGDARDALQIVDEADVAETAGLEQCGDGIALPLADLEQQVTSRFQRCKGLRGEAAIEGEAVCPRVERGCRLVVADLRLERFARSDIRRIRDDAV